MSNCLPARPSLDWLKKTAKQSLKNLRATAPNAKLADAQLALARDYGFSSWRALKAHVDAQHNHSNSTETPPDEHINEFLRWVGAGKLAAVNEQLLRDPRLLNAVGPHPYWGGRCQALHIAVETNRPDMVELLLDAGADVEGKNDDYYPWSPLALSLQKETSTLKDLLIARGARIGVFEALLMGDDDRVRKFLARGKSAMPKRDPNEGSILAFARTPFAIDRLLELGAPREQKDRWGATPIETMSRLGPEGQPLVRHMLSKGIPAEPQEYARLGDRATLERLFQTDPSLVKSDAIFMGAVDFGHHDLVEWLLSRGAKVNSRAPAHSNQTALHSAAWNGDLRMVKLLVAAGADVHAVDDEHKSTAVGWAEVSMEITNDPKCKDVIAYLLQLKGEQAK